MKKCIRELANEAESFATKNGEVDVKLMLEFFATKVIDKCAEEAKNALTDSLIANWQVSSHIKNTLHSNWEEV